MGGYFGVVSDSDCVEDLFYGTDYHSHLGTRRGGLASVKEKEFYQFIHNIEITQFRSKFENDISKMKGNSGIGIISDTDAQPLIIGSHLGHYAIVTVGKINNLTELVKQAYSKRNTHFLQLDGGEISPTELVATLINGHATFKEGIQGAMDSIDGSCSLLLLTPDGIFAARDKHGRTPMILGRKEDAMCVSMESCVFPNLFYQWDYELGPGEIVHLTADGYQQIAPPGKNLRICAFMWIYYGYPASTYEKINVEIVRNRCGMALARRDTTEIDLVAGVPDSGIAHAIGYANQRKIPYRRPFVKYTPTWPRSFMPQDQRTRDLVARMKLIPIQDLILNQRLLFCEDSIVRGTQLKDTVQRLYDYGAKEVHMRPACPPLLYSCRYLNFSRSRSEMDLAGRRAVREMGRESEDLTPYANPGTSQYQEMIDRIRNRLNLTSLQYQLLPDMLEAIGLPADNVCTFCWDGKG
ncbi:amidophosphoribosyltransferase [candidate division KSB1 bacterium]|nr:amidophosphoribosyltransferase [candidate division KSB1 bacterium]